MPATGQLIGAAVAFVWLGMVLAISFLETPLKFRAPGITLPLGLGIGRLVFRALNTVEVVLATALIIALLTITPGAAGWTPLVVTAAVLATQTWTVPSLVDTPGDDRSSRTQGDRRWDPPEEALLQSTSRTR